MLVGDKIKMYLKMGWDDMYWIYLILDTKKMSEFCENGNEPPSSSKRGEFY